MRKGILALSLAVLGCRYPTQHAVGGFLMASDYGVKCDGSTQNAGPLQNAINAAASTHRALYIEAGTAQCWFNTGLIISSDNVIVRGIGRPVLAYTGNGSAITIGKSSSVTYQAELSDLIIDLENAGGSAIGITEVASRNSTVSNVEIRTGQGRASSTGQTAVKLDGTGSFSAMNDFYSVYVHGDFAIGYLITGANSFNSTNSTHIVSGGVFNTAQSKTGTIGLRVAYGDTTRVSHTSIENWGTGARIESNFNGPIAARFENNQVDWEVLPNVQNASFAGAVFNNRSDAGTGTSYNSNGSMLQSQVGDTLVIPKLKAKSGARYVCVDTAGKLVSQGSPCSGS
jgi:hypothetical protein